MSSASFYKWRAKHGGMDASLISQMKAMEEENRRLKRMYADLSMQADLLKEALGKTRRSVLVPLTGRLLRRRVAGFYSAVDTLLLESSGLAYRCLFKGETEEELRDVAP